MDKQNKDIIISHKNCIDGKASVWISQKFNPKAMVIYIDAGQTVNIDSNFTPDKNVLCIDVIPVNLGEITTIVKSVTIIDHHSNNRKYRYDPLSDELKSKITIFMSDDACAVKLTWKFFYENEDYPLILEVIDDGDRYVWKNPNSKALSQTWIKKRYNVVDGFESILNLKPLEISEDIVFGNKLLDDWNVEVENYVKNALIADMYNLDDEFICTCYLCPTTQHRSDVGNTLVNNSKDIKLCAFYVYDCLSDEWRINLRSHKSVNCAVIAQMFPLGGGHPEASGLILPKGVHLKNVFRNVRNVSKS